ncbi:DNA gyrase inhibitor YacG [Rhodophyticola porphyridii]|uniref:DNA gyrase inhibitor YacG n=1 Tax=Rhodophyticola porphyridii TaxID=1852017 RepID=UPI0035D00843
MTCPICSKKTAPEYRPFCSRRCADVDLGRWLNGSYAIPSNDSEDADELPEALENARNPGPGRPH